MNSIDKNDVDISRLFIWGKEFTIKDEETGFEDTVYIKLAGDEDINRCRVYALREAAILRKQLRTPDSDERLAYIPEFDFLTRDQITIAVSSFFVKEFTLEAIKEVTIPIPKEPNSDSSQEDHEEYQAKVDNYPKEREDKLREYILDKLERKTKELEVLTDTQLYREYERFLINQFCEDKLQDKFQEMLVYLNIFSDKDYQKPYFQNLEQFRNLPTSIKTAFVDAYTSLDIGGEELKKSQEVTQ